MLWKEITKYVDVVKFQNFAMTKFDETGLFFQLNLKSKKSVPKIKQMVYASDKKITK